MLGATKPNDGQGLTVDDLLIMLGQIPPRARHNYVMVHGREVIGMNIAPSDLAGKYDLKIHLLVDDR